MFDKWPHVVSHAKGVLVGISVLLVACAAVGGAVPTAPVSKPASQAQAPDPAANVWLIFIDDLHLDFTATGRLKELFKKVATELVHEGDRFGVVSTGPSAIAIDLTRDRGRLSQALDQMAGAALRPSEILAAPDRDPSEVRYRAHVSFSTAYSVMQMLALVPDKRKAFIYISNGYYLDLSSGTNSQPARVNPFLEGGDAISLERLRAEAAELSRQAARSNVPIFGIDPRALSGPPTIDPNVNDAAWQKYWTTTRNSLQMISEQTSGLVIQDDLDGNLKRVLSAVR